VEGHEIVFSEGIKHSNHSSIMGITDKCCSGGGCPWLPFHSSFLKIAVSWFFFSFLGRETFSQCISQLCITFMKYLSLDAYVMRGLFWVMVLDVQVQGSCLLWVSGG
jgi:hypothetical protein